MTSSISHIELTVLSGPSAGDKFTFDLPPTGITIGRSLECQLILQDPLVSRRHAKIYPADGILKLADLGSSHGTVLMGFKLEAGEEHSRELEPEDEFKFGDSLFRVHFAVNKEVSPQRTAAPSKPKPVLKLTIAALGLVVVALLALPILQPESPAITQQRSNEKVTLPDKSSFGFLSEGDTSHADKLLVELLPSDGALEFDYISSGSTSILLDGVKIDTFPPTDGGWEQRMLLVRDPAAGRERILVFDEEKNTSESIAQGRPITRWGVRNLRLSPIPFVQDKSSDDALAGSLALAEALGRSSNSLYQLSKGLQSAGILLLREAGFDAQGVTIHPESPRPDPELVQLKLSGIIQERNSGVTPEMVIRHLKVIVDLIGSCEAELWRKFTVDLRQSIIGSRAKDYIQAHDRLLAIQTMIGDETDYRFRKAGELLDDKRVVPPNVRKNPDKYRNSQGER